MPARHLPWRMFLLCALAGCGRFGFSKIDVENDSRPSSAPPTPPAQDPAPPLLDPEPPQASDGGAGDAEDAGTASAQDASLPPDASAGDSGTIPDVGGGTNGCSEPPALSIWCADFDTQIAAGSYIDTYRGSTALVNSPVFRGAGALEANVRRAGGYAAVAADLSGFNAQALHARGYVYIGSDVVADDFTVFHLGHFSSPLGGTDIDITNGELETFSYADSVVIKSYVAVPRDQWFCLQVSIDLSSVAGSIRVALDGQQIVQAADRVTLPPEGITDFAVGLPWTGQQQSPLSVFIDEVAVGPSPIGCL